MFMFTLTLTRYCHVRIRQTSENQSMDRKCVVQINSRIKWSWFYSGMSEFNCLVVVLFSPMFSCFLLDSLERQEMVCLTKHEPLSLRSTFRGVMMNMLAIRYFCLILETEESISEIGSHHIFQGTSEL